MDFGFAAVSHHQGATVCSYETELLLPIQKAGQAVFQIMEALCQLCDAQGGLVGHVKAFLQSHEDCLTLSTTGKEVSWIWGTVEAECGSDVTEISFTAIILMMEDCGLRDFVESQFHVLENSAL